MSDDTTHKERLQRKSQSPHSAKQPASKEDAIESVEASCNAFGYLRGLREHSAAVELRFRSGNSMWFPYSWLGTWQFNPSEGLLLKFAGDVVYLVLIRGSNIDKPLAEGVINLTHAGLQRHRVMWIREMSNYEICAVGGTAPTIDSIKVAEFESHADLNAWLTKHAPEFSRWVDYRSARSARCGAEATKDSHLQTETNEEA
jgi:hypothetical protein